MTAVSIRQADIDDADALAAVYHSAYQENRELGFPAKAESVSEATVGEWIVTDDVYVAESDGELVGGVRLTETESGRVKLSRLGVHEEWKGNGVGSRLLEYAESTVQDQTTIWLTTPEEHPYLPAFYRSRGYEKTADYPLEYRDYDEIILTKRV